MHTASFEATPDSAKAARDFVRDRLDLRSDRVREVAVLLVSELAANSIVHAGSSFDVSVDVTVRCVRVSVEDLDPALPSPKTPDAEAAGGRGLVLVEAMADRWGTELTLTGKSVWFEIDT